MTMVEAAPQPQQRDIVEPRAKSVPTEPHLPAGKPLRSVQPLPLPIISQTPQAQPVQDEQALRAKTALARAETSGTGIIVDTIV